MHTFEAKIAKYIRDNNMLSRGDMVVLGVSGGADSTALFWVMMRLVAQYDLKLKVVHINHGIRREAYDEALKVQKMCEEQQIEFILEEYDVEGLARQKGIGTEEMGRELRYKAFNKAAGRTGKIAVAHNKNDLSETMLFHLFRGTGIKGLSSIQPVRDNVIRPLLDVSRKEIENYLSDIGVSFCTDATNYSDEYTRNRIRNIIIPKIEENVSKSAVNHMAETASQLREIDLFVEKIANKAYEECLIRENANEVVFDKDKFDELDTLIKKTVTKQAIDYLVPHNRDITHVHLESLLGLSKNSGFVSVDLPYHIMAYVSYNETGLTINNKKETEDYEIVLDERTETIVPGVGLFKTNIFVKPTGYIPSQNEYTKSLDYDKINRIAIIRNRREGDYLVVTKNGGKKKLKDYLINEKIPKELRNQIPVLATGNRVSWVVGYRISEDVKVTEDTKTVIEITFFKEDK